MAVNVDESPFWGSRSIECFEKLEKIDEGTYGQVYMAKDKNSGEIVALKKLRMDKEKEGFPITAIREIKILNKLQHENVIKLKEIVTGCEGEELGKTDGHMYKGSIYMVFEYIEHDLKDLLNRPGLRFTIPQIKCYMKQLLTGLNYCHINQVLHRGLKGSNLLVDNKGNLKLSGFRSARFFSNDNNENLTNRVITLWYRPPELLLGDRKYGTAVDMWSVGCIFAELLNGKPIIRGKTVPEQLYKIYELCGSPDETIWPGVSKFPWYNKFKPSKVMKRRVREVFSHFDRYALDLLDKMLTLDPTKRITAKDALDAEYFQCDPLPCNPLSMPLYKSSHGFRTKKRRQLRQNEEEAKNQKVQHPQQPRPKVPPVDPANNFQPPPQPPAAASAAAPAPPIGGQNSYPITSGFYQDRVGGGEGYIGGGPYAPPPQVHVRVRAPTPYPGPSAIVPRGGYMGGGPYTPPPQAQVGVRAPPPYLGALPFPAIVPRGGYIGGGPYTPPPQAHVGVRAPPPYPGVFAPRAIFPQGGVIGGYRALNLSQTFHYGGYARGGIGGSRESNLPSRNQQYGWQKQHRKQ